MLFDYSTLTGNIIRKYKTRGEFAKKMGISEHSMSYKLTSKAPWKQQEIVKACELLEISDEDIGENFFTPKVQ